jgi:GNAT superfamily N-acetyltransferase
MKHRGDSPRAQARSVCYLRGGNRNQQCDVRDIGALFGSMGHSTPTGSSACCSGRPAGRELGCRWGVSDRCCYGGVVEHSVCVVPDRQGTGVQLALVEALVQTAEHLGVWTIQTGVFPENVPSLALHERAGFRTVGTRERLGKLNGRWRDVVVLERRSNAIE